MQHLRIGSKLADFSTSMTGIDPDNPAGQVSGTATNVRVSNITQMYLEVQYDFVPSYPGWPGVTGLSQVRPWTTAGAFRVLED